MIYRHHRADDAERRKWQDPEAILAQAGLKAGDIFVDVGCGGGFFTLPAARAVGPKGKVYAVDANEESINELRAIAHKEGLANVEARVGRGEETRFCEGCADIVFFGIVLHDFDDPAKVLENARKMLKPKGRLVNLDWKAEATPMGPPLWKRFSVEKAEGLIKAAGFNIEKVANPGPYHYMIVARP